MSTMTPTVVAIYDIGFPEPRRVAEFRLTADGTAALTVTDPDGCRVAEQWYERGIKIYDPFSRVRPAHGIRFLRALLDMPSLSYYRVVDETPRSVDPPSRP